MDDFLDGGWFAGLDEPKETPAPAPTAKPDDFLSDAPGSWFNPTPEQVEAFRPAKEQAVQQGHIQHLIGGHNDDKGERVYAAEPTDAGIDERLGDRLKNAPDEYKQGIRQQYRGQLLMQLANQYKTDPLEYVTERLPFAGGVREAVHLYDVRKAANKIKDNTAGLRDYETVGQYLGRMKQKEGQSLVEEVVDMASHFPGIALEFGLTGGMASAGKVLAKKAAEETAGAYLKKRAVALGAGVATQTLRNPQRLAADYQQQRMPGIGADGQGVSVGESKGEAESAQNAAVNQVIQNAAFLLTGGTPGMAGKSIGGGAVKQAVGGTALQLTGNQAAAELSQNLADTGQGSSIDMIRRGDPKGLQHFLAELVAIGGAESGMAGLRAVQAAGQKKVAGGYRQGSETMKKAMADEAGKVLDAVRQEQYPDKENQHGLLDQGNASRRVPQENAAEKKAARESLQPLLDAADAGLPAEAQAAVTEFVGHGPKGREDAEATGISWGVMNRHRLERAITDKSPESTIIRAQLEEHFAPVREELRRRFGDSVEAYRVQGDDVSNKPSRNALSWTLDPDFAREYSGATRDRKILDESDIAGFEETLARTGQVKIGRSTLKATPDSKYLDIYEGGELQTDVDGIRQFVEWHNEDATHANARNTEKLKKLHKQMVRLDDVVWMTQRANQSELIVKSGPGQSGRIESRPADEKPEVQPPPEPRPPDAQWPKQKIGSDEPPIPEGHVRMYHGGVDQPGARWVAPDRQYATDYRRSPTDEVWYIDLPADSPHLSKSFNDEGVSMKAPPVNVELPPGLAGKMKRVSPPDAQTPVEARLEPPPAEVRPTPEGPAEATPGAPVAPEGPGDLAFRGRTGQRPVNAPQPGGEKPAGPFNIMASIDALFGKARVKTLPDKSAEGLYQKHVDDLMLHSRNAGNVPVRMHEEMHRIVTQDPAKPLDIAKLAPDVIEGLRQFDYVRNRANRQTAMYEGASEYVRKEVDGTHGRFTPEQMAAEAFLETYLKQRGFDKKINRVRDLFQKYQAGTPLQQASGQLSATGQPAKPVGLTVGERSAEYLKDWGEAFRDHWIDKFAAADRLEAAAAKTLHAKAVRPGEDLRSIIAATHHLNETWVNQILSEGAWEYRKQPNGDLIRVKTGKPITAIPEGLGFTKEELKPGGRLWTFVKARDAVLEAEMGKRMMQSANPDQQARGKEKLAAVSPDQLEKFKALVESEKKDPAKYKALEEAAVRYTEMQNHLQDALLSLGYWSPKQIADMRADHPTYTPSLRVMGPEPATATLGRRRSGSGRQIVDPVVAYKSQVEVASQLIGKQLVDNRIWEASKVPAGPRGIPGKLKEVEVDRTPPNATERQRIDESLEALGLTKPQRDAIINSMGQSALSIVGKHEPWSDNKTNYYTMRQNGEAKRFEVLDKLTYDFLTGQQSPLLKSLMTDTMIGRGVGHLNRAVKYGATTASMTFPVRNMVRDPWNYYQTQVAEGVPLGEMVMNFAKSVPTVTWAKLLKIVGKESPNPLFREYDRNVGEKVRAYGELLRADEGAKAYREATGQNTRRKEIPVRAVKTLQHVLETFGAGEHFGRFAAWKRTMEKMGYDRKTVEAALAANPDRSPIPLHVAVQGLRKAALATTDFGMLGSTTAEINRAAPFFGAHVTGMYQEGARWATGLRDLSRGKIASNAAKALTSAVGGYLALELLHHQTYKDEDWYNELPAHQRHRWFILGRTKEGGVWGIPKPHGLLSVVGAYAQEGIRAAAGGKPRLDLANKSAANEILPNAMPAGVNEAWAIRGNRDWADKPIVPDEGRDLTAQQKIVDYYAPYILKSLSGGMASSSGLRTPDEALDAGRVPPHQSVDDLYAQYHDMRLERLQSPERHAGKKFPKEKEFQVLEDATQVIARINTELAGKKYKGTQIVDGTPPTPERKKELQLLKIKIAQNPADAKKIYRK